MTLLDLDLLRTFLAIIDEGGFTRAGVRIGRTQSAVSLQIKRLEDAAGAALIARDRAGPVLTEAGEVLAGYARRILALHDEALARMQGAELEGRVRVGAPEDVASARLPSVLGEFARAHPGVMVDVRLDLTMNLMESRAAGELDLAIVKRDPTEDGAGRRLRREPLVFAAAPGAAPGPDQPVSLILAPAPCVIRKRALAALNGAGRTWRLAYSSPSLGGSCAAARERLGLAVLPLSFVPRDLEVLGEDDGLPALGDVEFALLEPDAAASPAAKRLAEALIRTFDTAA